MKSNKKEFFEFIAGAERPPEILRALTQKDILLSFRGKSLVMKFLFFQLLGALFSLSFCPQFGLGLMEGHGITHVFRMIGGWACASFCGSLFLSSGLIVAFIGMKGEELWWIWHRYKMALIILPPILWSGLMLLNVSFSLSSEDMSYHLIWIFSAILAQGIWLKLRTQAFIWKLHTN